MLLSLNEICPKQLRVIIGNYTEYPALYEKLVRHLDHTITDDLFSASMPDKHVFCSASEADAMFGSVAYTKFDEGYGAWSKTWSDENNEKLLKTTPIKWHGFRRYSNGNKDFRWLNNFPGTKIDIDNYMPMYMMPIVEKWCVNHFLSGKMEYYVNQTWPVNGEYVCHIYPDYRLVKTPLRHHIFKFTGDAEYSYNIGKMASGLRALVKDGKPISNENDILGVTTEGHLIRRNNIDDYDIRQFIAL
jgi:hypothetical protein